MTDFKYAEQDGPIDTTVKYAAQDGQSNTRYKDKTTRPDEIELSQVERMAWELWLKNNKNQYTPDNALGSANDFLDEVKKRREGK